MRPSALLLPAAALLLGTACHRHPGIETPAPARADAAAAHAGHGQHQHPAHEPAAPGADYSPADVRFMHHMILHHAQAIVMTDLVKERTSRQDIRLLAERIDVSQRDEIGQMERWLRARGEEVPTDPGHGAGHGHAAAGAHTHMMPGMLTEPELARLAAARGPDFDALFLDFMIRHHEGALQMVRELFELPYAGQETEIFRFASDAYADQRAEIARMRALQTPR